MSKDDSMMYLASPYSDPDPAVQERRFRAVCMMAARLLREGQLLYCPIAHTHPMAAHNLPKGYDFWQRLDDIYLDMADDVGVACLPGWEESVGVTAEIKKAKAAGKPVRHIMPLPSELAVLNPHTHSEQFHALLDRISRLHDAKNHDYAGDESPLANLVACERLGLAPWIGTVVRMQDKMSRIERFAKVGALKVKDESVRDTLMDLAVYSLLALCVYDDEGNTPTAETPS